MLKVRISGYYRSGKNNVDFNSEVVMPDCKEENLQSNVMYRVMPMHFATAEKPMTALGVCYVDKVVKDDKMKSSFNGKNIKDMEWEDIENVAIEYDLREAPLYRACSLREARERLYKEYSKKVLGVDCDKDKNYSYGEAKDIVVGTAPVAKKAAPKKATQPVQPVEEVATPKADDFDEQVDSLQKEFAGE